MWPIKEKINYRNTEMLQPSFLLLSDTKSLTKIVRLSHSAATQGYGKNLYLAESNEDI